MMLEINFDATNTSSNDDKGKANYEKFVKLSAKTMTYEDFFKNYMAKNLPCLIQDLMDDWPASKDFVTISGEPNLDYLDELIEDKNQEVPVCNCSEKYFNAQEKCSMSWQEYKTYWNGPRNEILYLKDWHLSRLLCENNSEKKIFYQTPRFFGSDFLNEYWENAVETDDYKFVYLGPKNSWTPFHTDVYGSYSWSANVSGFKKWIFFPRYKEPKNDDVYDVQNILPDLNNPSLDLKRHENLEYFVIMQGPKEVIFVPSGWYHQVFNITDTLSINHNWFNATNLTYILSNLIQELSKVQDEIKDCFEENNEEEWKELCQKLLLANHGMNFTTFIDLLACIYKRRKSKGEVLFSTKKTRQIIYSLTKVHQKIGQIMICRDFIFEKTSPLTLL